MEVKVMKKILSANDNIATELRKKMKDQNILFLNLMSSPGSGKTTLIEETVKLLKEQVAVVEGDIQTTLDAERIVKLGIKTYQINTGNFGGDCHLEAAWIQSAVSEMGVDDTDILFVENIGNLVCPAEFDVGAHQNVILLSVTEGEDKPLKYPLAFQTSSVCLITKTDLLPYLDISLDSMVENIKKVNPKMKIIDLSAKSGENMGRWCDFLRDTRKNK